MKKISKLLVLSILGIAVSTLSSCSVNKDNDIAKESRLSIVYYPGGYGNEYLNTFCKEFLAKKKGVSPDEIKENVDYILKADPNITYGEDYYVTSESRCPDIIISNRLNPKAVTQGYVASLDEVYDAKVNTSDGEKSVYDFSMKEAVEQFSFEIRRGLTDKHAFAVPWTAIPISIAYNNTILRQISHTSSLPVGEGALDGENKWNRAPETVAELKAIFKDAEAFNPNLTRFGWAAINGTNWFESLITTWWAQRQGIDKEYLYEGEGSYYDFWNYESIDIFKQTGIQDALGQIKELFAGEDGKYINSYQSVGSMNIKQAQQAFAEGKALFCLTGDFFEKEYASFIEKSNQEFKMMRVPSIEGAITNDDGTTKKLTYLNISSCAYVPTKAKNKDLAKEFLVFTCQEDNCLKMSEMTGAIRPFDYDARKCSMYDSLSAFHKSVFDLFYNADDYLLKFPRNVEIKDISPVYLYENVVENIFYGADYYTVISSLLTMTPKEIMLSGTKSFDSIYKRAQKAFQEWKRLYPDFYKD